MYQPLADKIRPKTLDDVVGQRHLLGENGLLRRVIESGSIPNLIFYGPSGVGKTTVASIIAQQTDRKLYHLNATTAGIADIKAIIDELDTFLAPNGALVYLDEIQYFNKKQQQSLLEFIETGKITLIASTTENPYFYVYNAILSRCTVFEFKPIEAADGCAVQSERALKLAMGEDAKPVEDGVADYIAQAVRRRCAQGARRGRAARLRCGDGRSSRSRTRSRRRSARICATTATATSHYDILSALHEVRARLRPGRGAALSRAAARGGRYDLARARRMLCHWRVRISAWRTRSAPPSSRRAWTARSSWACPRRGFRSRRRSF